MFSSLTLCSQTEEKRRRDYTDPVEASPGGASGCHMEAALPPSTEPLSAQGVDMALLSNILAAYSFVSGRLSVSAGPGLRPGAGDRAHSGETCYAIRAEEHCVLSFERQGLLV